MSTIDLHTHSNASDGSLSPAELIEKAKEQGLSAIALTDHDTIAGLKSAEESAKKHNIHFISGIEIGINWEPGDFHILGLGICSENKPLLKVISELAIIRENRNHKIIELMQKDEINVSYEEILAISGTPFIGRPHFARLLINKGIVKNQEQAFSRYLGKGRPFYVPKEGLELCCAIDTIKNSGGIAILAHPMSLYVSWGRLPELIKDFKNKGLDGIEAWHPTAKVRSCKRLETLGKSLELFITAGSDFHGETRPDRKLGITAGNKRIDESILSAIPNLSKFRN